MFSLCGLVGPVVLSMAGPVGALAAGAAPARRLVAAPCCDFGLLTSRSRDALGVGLVLVSAVGSGSEQMNAAALGLMSAAGCRL